MHHLIYFAQHIIFRDDIRGKYSTLIKWLLILLACSVLSADGIYYLYNQFDLAPSDEYFLEDGDIGFMDYELCCWNTGHILLLGDGELHCSIDYDGNMNIIDIVTMINMIIGEG